jgi:hypothetical protein
VHWRTRRFAPFLMTRCRSRAAWAEPWSVTWAIRPTCAGRRCPTRSGRPEIGDERARCSYVRQARTLRLQPLASRRPLDVMGQAGHGVLLLWPPRAAAPISLTSCRAYQLRDRCLDADEATSTLALEPEQTPLSRNPAKVEAFGREHQHHRGISLLPLPVPGMIYAVLPKKFPVRICRELKLKHAGFSAFGPSQIRGV